MSKRASESSAAERTSNKRSPLSAEEDDEAIEATQTQPPHVDDDAEVEEEDESDDDRDDESEEDEGAVNRRQLPAEAGVIHRIYCENFMNHRKLTVDFCRNINFIHGQNGSGKSAILAALQICLGARASVTHRGDNLGGLVRRNPSGGHTATALVQVTLLNGGPDAYNKDVYGKRITVERKFDAHGKNGYRVLNEAGKMVTTKKKDLEDILDHLNVQVDNPVCIMDQENSKEFIKGNEKEKYKFFAKATDLERVIVKIQASQNELDEMERQSDEAQSRLRGFAHDAQRAEDELKDLRQVLKIDQDILRQRCLMFWHEAESKEGALAEMEAKQEQALKKQEERKAALAKAQADLESNQTPEQGLAEIERLKGENDEAQKNVDRINRELVDLKKPVKASEREIGAAKRRAHDLEMERRTLSKQISDAQAEAASTSSGEEERRVAAKLEAAKAQADAAEAEARDLRERVDPAREEFESAERARRGAEQAERSQAGACRNLNQEVQQLRSSQDMPAARFGQKVPAILSMIEKESRFERKPVGPLGRHVMLRDGVPGGAQKWAKAVTVVLPRRTLTSFTVHSPRDMQLLQGIMKKCGAQGEHEISVIQFVPRYGPGGQRPLQGPQGDFLTVESVVNVDDDVAFNALIEKTSMEKAVLFDSHEEGERQCFSGPPGGLQAIQGVSRILDPAAGVTALRGGNKFFTPNPNVRAMAFGVDVKEQLEQVQSLLAEADKELFAKKAAAREAKERAQAANREFGALDKRLGKLNNVDRPQLQQAIQQLQAELSELQTEDAAVDTSEWEDELGRVKKEMEECEERVAELSRTKAEQVGEVNAKVLEKQNFEATANELQKQQEAVEQELSNLLRQGQQRQAAVEKAQAKVAQVEQAVATLKESCELALRESEAAADAARTYTAENLGPEAPVPMQVPAGKDKEYFKAAIVALRKNKDEMLRQLPKGQRNVEEAMQRALSAKAIYDKKVAGIKLVQENQTKIEADIQKRLKKWKKFRKTISVMTNSRFDRTLNKKGQCGEIEFKHKEKELHITVQKDNRDSQSQIDNVKLLSGGERSYATLSLLVALGECLECPFRVMDEFDVFMDVVSRKVALQQLISEGKANLHRQFVFITPQDLSSVTPSPEVRIIKLQNPDRMAAGAGQQTL